MSLVTRRSHIPILHVAKPKKAKKHIRKVSKKLSSRLREYMKVRDAFLKAHWFCEWTLRERAFNNEITTAPIPRATEIHHVRGRVGTLLTDTNYFMAVSAEGHRWIHANPKQSYERGYMLKR